MIAKPVTWLREKDVVDLVSLNDAIDALEQILDFEGQGTALNAPKALVTWGEANSLHALSSALTLGRYCGTKTWINTPNGAIAIFALFDGEAGRLLAVIEAASLGALRTAGMAGLATRWLAPVDAREMALVGSGRQALLQVAAVAAVRPLARIAIFSPTREHQLRFAETVADRFDLVVETPPTLAETVANMPIVTVVTRAREAFLAAASLAQGSHLNAVGAILPGSAEILPEVIERADLVVVDNLANIQKNSREFIEYFDHDRGWKQVDLLGRRIAAGEKRPAGADLTLFKSVGSGLADLAVASRAFEAAEQVGAGLRINYPAGASPRWQTLRTTQAYETLAT